jgi:hypothetical protein
MLKEQKRILLIPNGSKGADKINRYEQKRLQKMKALGKAYLKDYTEFNYKIDSILNEGYTFVKKASPPIIPPSRIKVLNAKDLISNLF